MIKKNKEKLPPVSIVIIHRNSSSTVLHTLDGIKKQKYPIKEVIIVDDRSTDDSIEKIKKFASKNRKLNLKIIIKDEKRQKGLSASNNIGVEASKSNHVIIMQADGYLPTECEIDKIMEPVLKKNGDDIAAVNPITFMPYSQWLKYNFWEKCLLGSSVNVNVDNFNGKFNYINKKFFIKAGGFDEANFKVGMGGEDGDLTLRLKKVGRIVKTKAKVIHLHYVGQDFSLRDWILQRRLYVRGYAKIMRMYNLSLPLDVLLINIKTVLVFLSFVPLVFPYALLLLLLLSFYFMKIMYTTPKTRSDPKIILLPLISLFLMYYETYWLIREFSVPIKKWKGIK